MTVPPSPTPAILPLTLDAASYAAGGQVLLSDVSVTITSGRRLVIMGANGAGKTLLLRLCHGLIDPTAGRRIWADGSARTAAQAMVFQRPVLLRRTVAANIAYPLALQGMAADQRRDMVARTLHRFGLTPLADRRARRLSGGEQQRVALARAWAMTPHVLFLDEPTSALDPSATRIIEDMIASIAAEGITIVMTTHDLGQARRLAEDVAFLHRGRLIEHRPAAPFFAGPHTPEARAHLAGDLIW
ncbi:amino acid ABC transporter ATP-binding protein, PAAT family [Loktanella fryxellensis]|uniref:Amino acid ABC transporter ATP-binding protein, PAAT family n=1 Tax=Loktanella fryxellensis TaxID=245187 RepID=A0A1H8B7H2_9RHOB|nr:ATP-binding cassette domain-containing protein [Loktanella fryxellensis]SEM78299.1 amino acid ABC transporter ATP-binding protein, PAAT family [Loktanella fryxellensis]